MKKITLWMLVLFGSLQMNAQQLWEIQSCSDLGSATYGPMNSVTSANATNRTAVIYPSSQLTGIIGQNLNAMYFKKVGTAAMLGTPNFKIYLKEVAASDFGAGSVDWATATTGATLVYDSNPVASVGSTAGWKSFAFSTNFLYSGTQNLAVFMEYTNSTASGSITWNYEYTAPCISTSNSTTTKYSNNTTGVFPATLGSGDYRRPLIGFDYVVSCPKPTGLIVSNVTSTTVNLAWTAGAAETQWEYAVVLANAGLPTAQTPTSTNSATNIPILPGTSYKAYVRAYCGVGDVSAWLVSDTFTSQCVEVATFFENFDSSATGAAAPMPNCWGKIGNGSAYPNTGSVLPASAPNRLYMFANSGGTTPSVIHAILPSVSNLQANTHRLKFKAYATTVNKSFEVGYMTDLLDASTFVLIETINLPGTTAASAQEFTINPTAIPVGVKNLVFKNPGTGSVTMYVDDVIWELIPTCTDVTNVGYSALSDTQATFNWTAGGTETAWQYVYGPSTVTDPSTLTPVDVLTTPSVTISSLTASTSYKIWVRSKCSDTALGAWIGPLSFSTLCTATTTFTENFDTSATGAANPMTLCWDRAGSGSSYITTGAAAPMSPSNRIYMNASGTTPTQAYVLMPPVTNLQAATHRLRFKAHASAVGKNLEVGYLGSASDLSTFTQIQDITELPSTVATSAEYVVEPTDIPVGITRLVFRIAPTVTTTTVYIDDVSWEVIPSCPDVSSVLPGNSLSTSAKVTWLPGGSETAWQYVYGATTVMDPNTLTPFNVTDTPETTITGLTPNTTYKVWVRSNCAGLFGVWSDPITITTTCTPITNYSENFDALTTGTTAPLPTCWTEFGTTGNVYPTTGGALPGSPPNRLYMNTSATTRAFTVLPPVSNLQAETHRFKFKAYASAANKNLEVGYFENSNDVATFILLESFPMPSTTAATATEFVLIPSGVPVGVESLVFRILGTVSGATTIYIDDVVWEQIPVCFDINTLSMSNLTNNSTTLMWTPGDSETAWQYVYGLSTVTDPTTLTPVDVTGAPTASISSLTSNTSYKYWVRSNCGSGNFGNWSQPFTFVTSCDEVALFSENFDTNATGTTSPMPNCWRRAGNGSTYVNTGGTAPGTAPNRLYMFATGSGTTPTQAFAIMPPVSNLQAETHRLRFKAYATTAARTLEIGFFGDISDVTTFILLETIDLPSTTATSAQEFIVNIEDVPVGVNSLVFRNAGISTGSTTLYIDDVFWEAIPTTAPSCVVATATPNTTCGNFATVLTWTPAAGTAEGYNLTVGTTPGGTDVINNLSIGNVTTYSFLGNANTTYYFTLVPFNLSGAATGCVEQSVTTLATGCYCTSIPTSNSGTGITNVQLGTTNFATGDVMYFDHTATAVDLAQGVPANLKINLGTTATYGVNVWIDFNNNFNFETSELVFQGESLSTTPVLFNASFAMPVTAPLGVHRMRIGTADSGQLIPNPCYSGTSGVTLDFNVNIIVAPSCLPPGTPTAPIVGATTATINWTASLSTPANGYQYAFSTVNTLPTTLDATNSGTVGAGVTTVALNSLTPNTVYYVWVKSICSSTDSSEWTNYLSFKTLCASVVPSYIQDFTTALPACWSVFSAGTVATGPSGTGATIWFADGFLNSGTTGAIKVNLYDVNRIGWMVSPTFDLSAQTGGSVLSFNYAVTTWNATTVSAMGSDDSVKMLMSVDNGVTWTELVSFDATSNIPNTEQTFTYNVTSTSATVKFAFLATDGLVDDLQDYDFFIDNFKVQTDLGMPSIENNTFKAYPNPVNDVLNISYTENISGVEVFNMLGQQVITKAINATSGQIDMANLAAGTYLVKVATAHQIQTLKIVKN